MNILFLVKFYQPFDRGGSEWSTHDLAKLLVKKGHKVTILTPNYGARAHQISEGITIERFPFLVKLKNPKAEITPWWTNNLFWFIYTSLLCTWYVIREKFDAIHVHSNEFLPAAVVSGLVAKKPTVATFRNYQAICHFSFCLWQKEKACTLREYLGRDFKFFYENYVSDKNPVKFIVLYLAAIRSRIITKIFFYSATKIKNKVAVSKQVARIFRANGISTMQIIHNPVLVPNRALKVKNEIVYLGKFSKGKGPDLLISIAPAIAKKFPSIKFKFVGSGVFKNHLKNLARDLGIEDKTIFTGHLSHSQAISIARSATLVVVPSIWPEPLPRSVIETILVGTPVVATKVGGIGEIIKNNVYGVLAQPNRESLKNAITQAIDKKDILRGNIKKDLKILKDHFSNEVVKKYLKVYQTV